MPQGSIDQTRLGFVELIRSEFEVKADMVLPEDGAAFDLFRTNDLHISLMNGKADPEGHVVSLVAKVIGLASSLKHAQYEHREELARRLDLLSLATQSRYEILGPLRSIEWTPGAKSRNMIQYVQQDARYPAERNLTPDLLETVQAFSSSDVPPYIWKALKYFRFAFLESRAEDQFVRLWQALEILAENQKSTQLVPITCRHCKADLVCKECGGQATRMPMAKQAIEAVFATHCGEMASTVSSRQFLARNTLIHGGSADSVGVKAGLPLEDIVRELCAVVWSALMGVVAVNAGQITVSRPDGGIADLNLVAGMHMSFPHDGDEDHPSEDRIPAVAVSIISSLRPQNAE